MVCICFVRKCSYLETCFRLSIGRFREKTVCFFIQRWVMSFLFYDNIFICHISFFPFPLCFSFFISFSSFLFFSLPLSFPPPLSDTSFMQSQSKIREYQLIIPVSSNTSKGVGVIRQYSLLLNKSRDTVANQRVDCSKPSCVFFADS